jgi:gluconokinase
MHSLLPATKDGEPLAPAMTWVDQRTHPQADALRNSLDSHCLYLRTGCPVQPVYHPAKLRWWREEAQDIWKNSHLFLALKDWVLFQLTGNWGIDFALASASGLLDIHRRVWDEETLHLAEIRPEQLPPLCPSHMVLGVLVRESSNLTGLPQGLPIILGSSDGALANLGSGAYASGQSIITVGTSGAVRHILDQPLLDQNERTWCYVLDENRWFRGGAINNAGIALHWVRERFYSDLPGQAGYDQLFSDAARVPAGAHGLLFLPYFTGERAPHWNPRLRATLHGLRLEHTRGHIARAVLEGIAYCLLDVWEALAENQPLGEPARLTGGIAQTPFWGQIVANVLGVHLDVIEAADASAIGAAVLCQHALGVTSIDDYIQSAKPGISLPPDPDQHLIYQERHGAFQDLFDQFN